RGGCSYGGFGLLRYVSCRSTALGAKRVCRQLSRRRLAFAPGAGAPTVGSGFSDMLCVGAPPSVRTGLPATPPPPADIRTRGGCSYSGFGLLRYVRCRSTALGAKRRSRQLRPPTLRTSWCSSLPGTCSGDAPAGPSLARSTPSSRNAPAAWPLPTGLTRNTAKLASPALYTSSTYAAQS